jgi:dTDP-4-dehydrorhamnose reductase
MRLLVTGSGGMLGREVVVAARRRGHDVIESDRRELDITAADAVEAFVRERMPSAIVNCAAFTAVDACETEIDRAIAVNGAGPAHLARAAAHVEARLVHVSTDYVFDGLKNSAYVESDDTNPRSEYGRSKLIGEQAVAELADLGLVVRTAWAFGRHGTNIVKTVLRTRQTDASLRFVDDQRGSPTSSADLAGFLVAAAELEVSGVLHATNAGAVTWYEFVREVLRQCGDDPVRVVPIRTDELDPSRPAPRPANSVLASERLVSLGLAPLRRYEEALADVLDQLRDLR